MTPVDSAFRPMLPSAFPDGVGVHTFFTGLNHTARPLAVYASDTRSPSHPQDSLPAVPSALAGQDWLPAGFQFEVSAHGFLLNQTWAGAPGRRGGGRAASRDFWVSRCRPRSENLSCSLPRRIFFDSVLRIKKCVLALADLPASPPPCDLEGSRHELSARQRPQACRSTRPNVATAVSARWAAARQPTRLS